MLGADYGGVVRGYSFVPQSAATKRIKRARKEQGVAPPAKSPRKALRTA